MHLLDEHISRDGFRLRGTAMSRIDAFSDVVFGFALTLIVVSLDVPRNFGDLHHLLRGFPPFAITFLMLMLVWHTHYKFFRRFGLHDLGTISLNAAVLFCVLFYVYPLKFMFAAAFRFGVTIATAQEARELTLLYCAGFSSIYFLFAGMYANARRQRERLALTSLERRLTTLYFWEECCTALVGVIVAITALLLPPENSPMACLGCMLITIHQTVLGRMRGKTSKALPHLDPDTCAPDM